MERNAVINGDDEDPTEAEMAVFEGFFVRVLSLEGKLSNIYQRDR